MRIVLLFIFTALLVGGAWLLWRVLQQNAEVADDDSDEQREADLQAQMNSFNAQLAAQGQQNAAIGAQIAYNNCAKNCGANCVSVLKWIGACGTKDCRNGCLKKYEQAMGLTKPLAKVYGNVVTR